MKGSWAFLLFYVRQINDRWRCDNTRVVTVTREKSPQLKIRNVRSRQRRRLMTYGGLEVSAATSVTLIWGGRTGTLKHTCCTRLLNSLLSFSWCNNHGHQLAFCFLGVVNGTFILCVHSRLHSKTKQTLLAPTSVVMTVFEDTDGASFCLNFFKHGCWHGDFHSNHKQWRHWRGQQSRVLVLRRLFASSNPQPLSIHRHWSTDWKLGLKNDGFVMSFMESSMNTSC